MTFVFQSVHLKHPDDANMRSMPFVVVDRGRSNLWLSLNQFFRVFIRDGYRFCPLPEGS